MYCFNEEKVFIDSMDGQLVALQIETGSYYTFNNTATAIVKDLGGGYMPDEIALTLQKKGGDSFDRSKLDAFLSSLLEIGILEESSNPAVNEREVMECEKVDFTKEGFDPSMEKYDDVASYFMIDPIHEVNPEMGWPHVKPEDYKEE